MEQNWVYDSSGRETAGLELEPYLTQNREQNWVHDLNFQATARPELDYYVQSTGVLPNLGGAACTWMCLVSVWCIRQTSIR